MRLLVILVVAWYAVEASNPACEQYVECMAAVRTKQQGCAAQEELALRNAKLPECDAAKEEHLKMTELLQKKAETQDKCVSEKAADAVELTGARKNKCDKILAKIDATTPAAPSATTESEKIKRAINRGQKNKVAKLQHRACLRETRQQRTKCIQLSKCCPAVKQCEKDGGFKAEIVSLRKNIKEKNKSCRQAAHKNALAQKSQQRKQKKGKKEQDKKSKKKSNTTAKPTSAETTTAKSLEI
ncbi:unnamed protein product, partial [Mesorhabditis spiculigera]